MKRVLLSVSALAVLIACSERGMATAYSYPSGSTKVQRGLSSGDSVTVGSGATLYYDSGKYTIDLKGANTITNNGTISQTGTGRTIRSNTDGVNLTLTNNVGAIIQSYDNDTMQLANPDNIVLFNNYGSIISTNTSQGGAQAIDWASITTGSNTLNNYSTGIVRATAADAMRPGKNGVINNAGLIEAIPIADTSDPGSATGSDGIDTVGDTGVSITNSGTIRGRHGITGGGDDGVQTSDYTIAVQNNTGGLITGVNGAGINIDGALVTGHEAFATITNNGTITGNFDSAHYTVGDGDGVDVDGRVNLTNNGIIRGTGAGGNGSDGGGNNAEGISIGGGTVVNNEGAEISGQNLSGTAAAGNGLLVDNSSGGSAFAATTVTNSGLIRGYSGFGIKIVGTYNDTVTNNATGTIRGAGATAGAAVQTGDGDDTVTNRGAITGDNGAAVDLGGGNDSLRVEGGSATITGSVDGGSGTNSVVIDPGAGNSFAYAGTVSNFATMEIHSGTVHFSGANTYTGQTQITGGRLVLDGNNRLAVEGTLSLGGGTLQVNGSQAFASLTITGNATIDLEGTTALTFASFDAISAGANLSIINYDASLSPDFALRFSGDWLTDGDFSTFLNNLTINGSQAIATFDGTNTVLAVPEPSTSVLVGVGLTGLLLLVRRRRLARP